jgi:hypothetical protein
MGIYCSYSSIFKFKKEEENKHNASFFFMLVYKTVNKLFKISIHKEPFDEHDEKVPII